jgi:hypothetical protein
VGCLSLQVTKAQNRKRMLAGHHVCSQRSPYLFFGVNEILLHWEQECGGVTNDQLEAAANVASDCFIRSYCIVKRRPSKNRRSRRLQMDALPLLKKLAARTFRHVV